MSFWTKLGLPSLRDIEALKEHQESLTNALNKLQDDQVKAILDLKKSILKELKTSTDTVTVRMDEQSQTLAEQISDLEKRQATAFKKINSHNKNKDTFMEQSFHHLDNRMATIEEIVKIHWANVLLDHVDLVLEEVESGK